MSDVLVYSLMAPGGMFLFFIGFIIGVSLRRPIKRSVVDTVKVVELEAEVVRLRESLKGTFRYVERGEMLPLRWVDEEEER